MQNYIFDPTTLKQADSAPLKRKLLNHHKIRLQGLQIRLYA